VNNIDWLFGEAATIANVWDSDGAMAAARRLQANLADAWDEGHQHCFHVEDPNNPINGNPYREVPE
jgi:hypothetical protein